MTGQGSGGSLLRRRQLHAKPSCKLLHELPGDAARARAARRRPFKGLAFQRVIVDLDAEMAAIAPHHGEIFVLAAAVEAEPETEAIRQRDLLLDGFAGIDRGRALVLDHLARQQMAAVGGGVEDDVLRPTLDATFEYRLERFVGRIIAVEGEVVAEHDEAEGRGAKLLHEGG